MTRLAQEFRCPDTRYRRGFKLRGLANVAHATDGDLLRANATYRQLNIAS
jgi:hypothetical protein